MRAPKPITKMIPMPESDKDVDWDWMLFALEDAVKQAYKLNRRSTKKDIVYRGYDIGDGDKVTNLSPDKRLSAETLKWMSESHGLSAMHGILQIAFLLGKEHGRRCEKDEAKRREKLAGI
jgi:hypothetical protein